MENTKINLKGQFERCSRFSAVSPKTPQGSLRLNSLEEQLKVRMAFINSLIYSVIKYLLKAHSTPGGAGEPGMTPILGQPPARRGDGRYTINPPRNTTTKWEVRQSGLSDRHGRHTPVPKGSGQDW